MRKPRRTIPPRELAYRRGEPRVPAWRRIGLLIVAALELITLSYFLLIAPQFRVRRVIVKGTGRPELLQQIQSAGQESVARGLWSRFFLMPGGTLAAKLKSRFGEIKTLTVTKNYLDDEITITVADRPFALAWSLSGTTWSVDYDGIAVEPAAATDSAEVAVEDDRPDYTVAAGQKLLPKETVGRLIELSQTLKGMNIQVARFRVSETYYQVYAVTNLGFEIILDTLDPIEREIYDLKQTLTYLKDHNLQPKNYLNVTVPGRAFWK